MLIEEWRVALFYFLGFYLLRCSKDNEMGGGGGG